MENIVRILDDFEFSFVNEMKREALLEELGETTSAKESIEGRDRHARVSRVPIDSEV